MRVALYLRRSTVDLQPDSLAAQEERLRSWVIEHNHEGICLPGELKRCDDRFTEDSPQRGEGLESSLLARL